MITQTQVYQRLESLRALVITLNLNVENSSWYTEIVPMLHTINRHNPTIADRLVNDTYRIAERYVIAKQEIIAFYGTDMLPDEEEERFADQNDDIEQELFDTMEVQLGIVRQYNTPQMLQALTYTNPLLQYAMELV